jgi:FixJ family two-component response regulator
MTGPELRVRLAQLRPDLPALFMSGYTDDALAVHGVLEPGTAFIEKPFTPEALARAVGALLDRSAPATAAASGRGGGVDLA